jgi:hypothetical protein
MIAGVGTLINAAAAAVLYKAHRTVYWPSTTAKILSSSIERGTGRSAYWYPSISFEYEVDGTTWVSWTYSVYDLASFFFRGPVDKIVARHPVGSHASVVYPPFEPQRAILARGARPIVSAVMRFVVIGSMMMYAGFFRVP